MPFETFNGRAVYFDEPRLRMSVGGRFVVRIVSSAVYATLLVATASALLSEIPALHYVGLLILLFFADRLVHLHQADRSLGDLKRIKISLAINAARYTRPAALGLVGRVFDHGLLARQDFFLLTANRLLDADQVKEILIRAGVNPEEFHARIRQFLKEKEGGAPKRGTAISAVNLHEIYIKSAERLGAAAFKEAVAAGHNFVELADFFTALAVESSEPVQRVFHMFSLNRDTIRGASPASDASTSG